MPKYPDEMALPYTQPELPEYMTWEELERLPEEIAEQIELWDGRVVWLRRGPSEHQTFTNLLWSGLRKCARDAAIHQPENCWRATTETNVFLRPTGRSDFLTPDFLVHRCLESPYQDVRATDVSVVGEVLSPSNKQSDMDAKRGRYASAGIPWYWEITLAAEISAIAMVRIFGLESEPGSLPDGVHPLRTTNYLVVGEWTPADSAGIAFDFPFPIHIPWDELEF